jgi:hypothetical protein
MHCRISAAGPPRGYDAGIVCGDLFGDPFVLTALAVLAAALSGVIWLFERQAFGGVR